MSTHSYQKKYHILHLHHTLIEGFDLLQYDLEVLLGYLIGVDYDAPDTIQEDVL